MRIEPDLKIDFKDVLLRPKRSTLKSRSEIDLVRSFKFRHTGRKWEGIPIIASNMDHTGTFEMARALSEHKLMTALSKFRTPQEWEKFYQEYADQVHYCFISAGLLNEDFETLKTITSKVQGAFICLDVANGYTERFVEYVRKIREAFPEHIIMAGNVVTGEMTEELILSGADIVKVGIGPGSVCTTRYKTGIGYPQLSAVIECADAAHGIQGHVCSDGGCQSPGDVVKAFAAGADFVMLGGMFAGHDECEGGVFEKNGKQYKHFYGMSSKEAMERHHGKVAEYRASEGISSDIPYKGSVHNTVQEILGGLRSACTYVGSDRLKTLPKCATFIRVTTQSNVVVSDTY